MCEPPPAEPATQFHRFLRRPHARSIYYRPHKHRQLCQIGRQQVASVAFVYIIILLLMTQRKVAVNAPSSPLFSVSKRAVTSRLPIIIKEGHFLAQAITMARLRRRHHGGTPLRTKCTPAVSSCYAIHYRPRPRYGQWRGTIHAMIDDEATK